MKYYIDTSAFAKVLIEEKESEEVKKLLDSIEDEGSILISSALLETEARRVAHRNNISQDLVTMLIDKIQICDVTRVDFRRAGLLVAANGTRDVRSLDAIHLAVAESQLADVFITYDAAQALAVLSLGMALKTK